MRYDLLFFLICAALRVQKLLFAFFFFKIRIFIVIVIFNGIRSRKQHTIMLSLSHPASEENNNQF